MIFLALGACKEKNDGDKEVVRPIRAMMVSATPTLPRRNFPGRAKASQEATLAFEVAGRLTTLPVKVGSVVEKGDVLAALDPRDFDSALASAKAEAARAEAQYARIQKAAAANAVSRQDVSNAQATFHFAKAQVDIKTKALEDATLRAPYKAVVVAIFFQNFETVQPKQPALRILNPTRIEMVVDVPEDLISLVHLGAPVVVAFDSAPGIEIPAQISEIGAEAQESTRTFPVTLSMEQPEKGPRILPGMAGRAWRADDINLPSSRTAAQAGLEIPLTALVTDTSGKSFVWVIDVKTQTALRREVKTGPLTQKGILVLRGLNGGDVIAIAGANTLKEGQRVRILQPSSQKNPS